MSCPRGLVIPCAVALLLFSCVGGDLGLEAPVGDLSGTGDTGNTDDSSESDVDVSDADSTDEDVSSGGDTTPTDDVDGTDDVSDSGTSGDGDTDTIPTDSTTDVPEWNACGGESPLEGPHADGQPGDACGACDDGILVCDGRTALRCVGAREPNPCGGCQPLPYNPGESCGPCADGTFTCQEDGAGACAGASRLNACGWCDALPGVPGQTCAQRTNSSDEGDSGSATWICAPHAGDAPAEMLRCLPGGRNACGGTGVLSWLGEAASPGLPCGSCGGQLACESGERLACVLDASVNACGGCMPSDLEPGDPCGSCGTVVCDEELQFPVCRERQHPCGACTADPEDEVDPEAVVLPLPGTACGADDGGADDADEDHAPVIARWACADTDERVLCLPLDTSVNACGGTDDLEGQPGESCDDCPARWWSCDGPDNVLCLGASGVPFATSCESCRERLDPVTHPCAACGERVWTCDGELPVCDGDIAPSNECGGCRPLHAEPGDECGSGDIAAHWTCDPSDPERVVCSVSSSGTLDRCTDLQCGGQNRVCISGGDNQHDRCGGCLPAFEEVDGECISNECAGGIQDCPIFGEELGWFVAPASSGGNPNGSMAAPFNNVQDGINAASTSSTRRHVYIAMGTYEESLNLANRVSLFGGFDPETGWSRSATNLTRIASPSPVALRVSGYSGEGTVEFLEFVSADAAATGVSSQAAILIDVDGALVFRANTFQAGRGADGQAGADGANGLDGQDGRNGSGGSPGSGGASSCAAGGRGGNQGGLNGQAGVRGDTASPGGASGGAGGTGGNSGLTICIAGGVNAGSAGRPGGDGTHGPSGQGFATQARGALNTQGRWSAGNGHNGSRGQHGGGGGGGGGASCSGGAGGGGGGAGCGGGGGQGGTGAGGSIAVTVARSPGAAFEGNTFRAADGGDGGRGGAGQPGGDGGRSGNGGGSRGEPGGRGGDGGHGGHGGGGAGGASIGVLVFQSTGFQLGPGQTFELGAGGQPGTATSPGAPGAQGLSQDVIVLP